MSSVVHVRPSDPAEAVEFGAFIQLLPELKREHGGQYVAVHGGRVIACGDFLDPVLRQSRVVAGDAVVYCGWVEPADEYVFRSGRVDIGTGTG